MVKVGILGVGTVGASVARILEENGDIIEARAGEKIVVKSGVVKNLSKDRGVSITLSDNPYDVVDDPEIDIVIELMGGVDEPYRLVKKALENGTIEFTSSPYALITEVFILALFEIKFR